MSPKLEETIYVDFITSASTGAAADADSTPTCEVFEDATDTAILSPTVTKRTSKTGNYRIPIACTAANGFETGKSYNVVASATVGGVAAKAVVARFMMRTRSIDDASTYAGGDTSGTTTLLARLTSTRAGYLDNLSAGAVATASALTSLQSHGDSAWATATGFSTLTAAGVRTALGMANANMDTQLAGIETDLGTVNTNVLTRSSHSAADVWAVGTRTLTAGTNIILAKGVGVTGFNDLSASAVNAEVVDVLETDTPVDGKSIVVALKIIAALTGGKVSGAGTGTETFKGLDGSTTRAVVVVDTDGNRTGVTYP